MEFYEELREALDGPAVPARLEAGRELFLLMRWSALPDLPALPGLRGSLMLLSAVSIVESEELGDMQWRLLDHSGEVLACGF